MRKNTYESIKDELVSRGFSDDGSVAVGNVHNLGFYNFFGALGGMLIAELGNGELIFSMRSDHLIIIPYIDHVLQYEEGIIMKRDNIASVNEFGSIFTFTSVNKEKRTYNITRGRDAMKNMVARLGFENHNHKNSGEKV